MHQVNLLMIAINNFIKITIPKSIYKIRNINQFKLFHMIALDRAGQNLKICLRPYKTVNCEEINL